MRALLPLLLAAGCSDGRPPDDSGPPDSAPESPPPHSSPPDTGDSGGTGAWPPYGTAPGWRSDPLGYATGAGFADVDGDGQRDLLLAYGNDMEPGPLALHLARDGVLAAAPDWRSDALAYHGHLTTGDVDGDGWTDVVVAIFLGESGFEEPGGVALYLNEGGSLPATPSWEARGFHCFSVALGDVDNDGDLDLAAATGEPYHGDPEPDLLFLNEGGAFQDLPAWKAEDPSWSFDAAFLDVDRDGALDLAFARMGAPHALYLNEGSGLSAGLPERTPAWQAEGERFEGNSLDFGDVDGDGWLDLAVTDNQQLGGPGVVSLYAGPDLALAWSSADESADQSAVALADLDADGDLDLAASAWWGALRLYRNEGGLESEPSYLSEEDGYVAEAIALHDLDGAEARELLVEGPGPLLALPRPCEPLATNRPGALGDGWFSAPTAEPLAVLCRTSPAPDLLLSDWSPGSGCPLFPHLGIPE